MGFRGARSEEPYQPTARAPRCRHDDCFARRARTDERTVSAMSHPSSARARPDAATALFFDDPTRVAEVAPAPHADLRGGG
jgi:hypothetical protein